MSYVGVQSMLGAVYNPFDKSTFKTLSGNVFSPHTSQCATYNQMLQTKPLFSNVG